jgi:uncharacterized protein (DUF58 family)
MPRKVEEYLKPEVIRQIKRLDLKARFIVEGFYAGLHASPFHGFSTDFSEHRKYVPGDEPRHIDWSVFAKTDRLFIKKYEARTTLDCYLILDSSGSMDFTSRPELPTKFEYCVYLAASLGYLVVHQQDSVGMVLAGQGVEKYLPPRSKRSHLTSILVELSKARPRGQADLSKALNQVGALAGHKGLLVLFSDLLADPQAVEKSLFALKRRGHDLILFHVLDAAEADFPYRQLAIFEDPETGQSVRVDAKGFREAYLDELERFRSSWARFAMENNMDFVPLATSMPFGKALVSFLASRQIRTV